MLKKHVSILNSYGRELSLDITGAQVSLIWFQFSTPMEGSCHFRSYGQRSKLTTFQFSTPMEGSCHSFTLPQSVALEVVSILNSYGRELSQVCCLPALKH